MLIYSDSLLKDYPQLKFAYNQSKQKIREKKEVIQQLNLVIAAEEVEVRRQTEK